MESDLRYPRPMSSSSYDIDNRTEMPVERILSRFDRPQEVDTSRRIDIHGQQGLCEEVTVSRSMPVILAGHMNHSDWIAFCDNLDKILLYETKLKTYTMIYTLVSLISICVVIIDFVSLAIDFVSLGSRGTPTLLFYISLSVAIGVLLCGGVVETMITIQVKAAIRKVCEATTAMHTGISFNLRYFRSPLLSYIEVNVSNTGTTEDAPTVQAYVAPSAPSLSAIAVNPEVDVGAGKKSSAERMVELNQMRRLLSDDEYQQKRAEILSRI